MAKKYHYFVSYFFSDNAKRNGYSNVEVFLLEPVTNWEGINNLTKLIEDNFPDRQIVILNYQFMRETED